MTSKLVISELSDDHRRLLDEQRGAIADVRAQMVENGDASGDMEPLDFLQVLLSVEIIPDDAIAYQEAMGVLIGDYLVDHGMVWRSVEDEWGNMPAISHPTKKAVAYPMASVVKRFDRGERVFDVRHFADETLHTLERLVAGGEVGDYTPGLPGHEKGTRPEPRPFINFIRGLTGRKSIN